MLNKSEKNPSGSVLIFSFPLSFLPSLQNLRSASAFDPNLNKWQKELRMGMCSRSRSAGRLNLTKDCPHLGDNSVSWLKAWSTFVAVQLIGFLKREGGKRRMRKVRRKDKTTRKWEGKALIFLHFWAVLPMPSSEHLSRWRRMTRLKSYFNIKHILTWKRIGECG